MDGLQCFKSDIIHGSKIIIYRTYVFTFLYFVNADEKTGKIHFFKVVEEFYEIRLLHLDNAQRGRAQSEHSSVYRHNEVPTNNMTLFWYKCGFRDYSLVLTHVLEPSS